MRNRESSSLLRLAALTAALLPAATGRAGVSWSAKAALPFARVSLAGGAINGLFYVVGGYTGSAYLSALTSYDPATNAWTAKTSMFDPRDTLAAAVISGNLYAVGGYNGTARATLESYDPTTNSWTQLAAMPTARYRLAAGAVGGTLFAVGGFNGTSALATVEAYYSGAGANVWAPKAALPVRRERLAVGVINGVLYAAGGDDGSAVGTLTAYDPTTDAWTTKSGMPTAREGLAVAVANGRLFALGGTNASGAYLDTVESYDPVTDTWSTERSLATARWFLTAATVNDVIYAAGGYNGSYLTTNEAGTVTAVTAGPTPGTGPEGLVAVAPTGITIAPNVVDRSAGQKPVFYINGGTKSGSVEVRIVDAGGRVVNAKSYDLSAAGSAAFAFDPTTDNATLLAPGVYHVVLAGGGLDGRRSRFLLVAKRAK